MRVYIAIATFVLGTTQVHAQTAGNPVFNTIRGDISQATVNVGTARRTLLARAIERLNVLDYGADATGTADSSAAFTAAYAASVAGQSIVVPQGRYRINTPPSGSKLVAWSIQGATDQNGGDLIALLGTGHLTGLLNQSGNVTLAQRGTTLGLMDIFGGDGIALGVVSLGNAIVGYSDNHAAGSTAFGTGVTGVGRLAAAGGQVFGVYGQVNMYSAGVGTNELDIFNYAGPPSTQLPPNRGFGTTENNAITLTIGGGSGTYPSSIGTHYAYSGTSMVTGIYMGADAVTSNGIYIDATPGVGPTNPFVVKSAGTNTPVQISNSGPYNQGVSLTTWAAGGAVRAAMAQDGTLYAGSAYRIDGTTGGISGSVGNFATATNNSVGLVVSNSGTYNAASSLATFSAGGATRAAIAHDGTLYSGSAYRLGGDGTFANSGTITTGGTLTAPLVQFTPTTSAKVNLYSNIYGIGVASSEFTLFSGGAWAFRAGGNTGAIVASITASGAVQTSVTTVAALGACSAANDGTRWAVRDATAMTYGATLAGGGAVHSPAYCNGTAWITG